MGRKWWVDERWMGQGLAVPAQGTKRPGDSNQNWSFGTEPHLWSWWAGQPPTVGHPEHVLAIMSLFQLSLRPNTMLGRRWEEEDSKFQWELDSELIGQADGVNWDLPGKMGTPEQDEINFRKQSYYLFTWMQFYSTICLLSTICGKSTMIVLLTFEQR
jgi:hypothetical protein